MNEQKGIYYFLSGFVISISVSILLLSYRWAQAKGPAVITTTGDYAIPAEGYYPVSRVREVKEREVTTKQEHNSISGERKWVNISNKWDKKEPKRPVQLVLVQWFPEDSQATKIATYAYKVSWGDMDFLMTLKAENWAFDMYLQSRVSDKHWRNWREDSRWLCQLHRTRHKDVVDDKRFWNSREFQVEKCREKYKWWTKFYWYYVRNKYKWVFTLKGK